MSPDNLVPALLANVDMHPVRSDVLLIYSVSGHAGSSRRRASRIILHVSHVRGVQFGNLSAQIVHHEADMVDAAEIRCLVRSELGRAGPVLQDGKIDVAVAEPDAVLTGVLRLPVQLLQIEVFLVEFSGTRRIVARDREVLDTRDGSSSFVLVTSGANAKLLPGGQNR